jgi:hypothetical protein
MNKIETIKRYFTERMVSEAAPLWNELKNREKIEAVRFLKTWGKTEVDNLISDFHLINQHIADDIAKTINEELKMEISTLTSVFVDEGIINEDQRICDFTKIGPESTVKEKKEGEERREVFRKRSNEENERNYLQASVLGDFSRALKGFGIKEEETLKSLLEIKMEELIRNDS